MRLDLQFPQPGCRRPVDIALRIAGAIAADAVDQERVRLDPAANADVALRARGRQVCLLLGHQPRVHIDLRRRSDVLRDQFHTQQVTRGQGRLLQAVMPALA